MFLILVFLLFCVFFAAVVGKMKKMINSGGRLNLVRNKQRGGALDFDFEKCGESSCTISLGATQIRRPN